MTHEELQAIVEERNEKIRKATRELVAAVNGYGVEDRVAEIVIETLRNQHRTLQQSFWRMIFKTIELYGKTEEYGIDGRNFYAVQACQEIKAHRFFLPMV